MKDALIKKHEKHLYNIYPKELLKNNNYDYVVVLKNQEKAEIIDNILYTNNRDIFLQNNLIYSFSPIRKPKKLLTYSEGLEILNRVDFGTLAITNDIPYCTSLNHFLVDGHLYFHCGYQGYKLNGIGKMACYNVVENLGINQEASTHNHQSVHIYGMLREVKANKKALLEAFIARYAPHNKREIPEVALQKTMLLELDIFHMNAKRHFH